MSQQFLASNVLLDEILVVIFGCSSVNKFFVPAESSESADAIDTMTASSMHAAALHHPLRAERTLH